MITLGRVLSYATEIIGASGSIRALSSFSEASSPPRALSGTLRRTNLNKTWWERVQVHGNREVKPIPSEVWSNQALAARMDLFDSECDRKGKEGHADAIDYIASTAKELDGLAGLVFDTIAKRRGFGDIKWVIAPAFVEKLGASSSPKERVYAALFSSFPS